MCIKEKGQTLIELIVVMAVGIVIITALTFAAIYTLRNANFAKNQAQATKLAQGGMETVRSIRDRDPTFVGLWSDNFGTCANGTCYYIFSGNSFTSGTNLSFEDLGNGLKRQIQMKNGASFDTEKIVTVLVRWSDISGDHDSNLTTVLRNQ